ncbi:MAG: hypothetical protein R3E90_13435 [Marinicella sp.]
MKKLEFQKFTLSRNAILAMSDMDARNHIIASKIYSDIAFGYYDFSELTLKVALKSKTPEEHITSYKLLNSVLGLSSLIFEAYKFFVTVEYLKGFLSKKKIKLKNEKEYPYKYVRDMIGNHYAPDLKYAGLFHEIFKHYHVLAGKKLSYYLSLESHKSAFPETTNIYWIVMFIIDSDKTWKAGFYQNKGKYVRLKLEEIMTEENKAFQEWLNNYIDEIIESKKIVEECCISLLSSIYHKK